MLLAATFELAGASLRAAVYAMGKAHSILRIHVFGITTYVVMFFVLTPITGLIGPGLAGITSSLLVLTLTGLLIKRIVRGATGPGWATAAQRFGAVYVGAGAASGVAGYRAVDGDGSPMRGCAVRLGWPGILILAAVAVIVWFGWKANLD